LTGLEELVIDVVGDLEENGTVDANARGRRG